VTDARLSTISYGEEKPAVEGHDESSWVKNRRAAFVLTVK
jgi:peptidoglycan-associated lipoprotein